MPEQDWLKVYNASHLLEAHNLKGMLQAMGIEVSLKGEGLVAGAGELPPSGDRGGTLGGSGEFYQSQRGFGGL